ncbi:hypothetical protein HQN90_26895 [Paenibacillus alba]|uniref:MauE/DoxX family redox-associated membrane protein n=1 Tax=Paenibacillus alba TaxID=1197127 RepID=UPI001563A969|nr:hypothetical protein [Paenibacillus alba]
MSIISNFLAMLLGFMYLSSATAKSLSFIQFYHSIKSFGIIKGRLIVFVGCSVIFIEIGLGVSFIEYIHVRLAFIGSAVLMLLFTILFVHAKRQQKQVTCNCFGSSTKQTNIKHSIIRNLILVIVSITGSIAPAYNDQIKVESLQLTLPLVTIACLFQLYKESNVSKRYQKVISISRDAQ